MLSRIVVFVFLIYIQYVLSWDSSSVYDDASTLCAEAQCLMKCCPQNERVIVEKVNGKRRRMCAYCNRSLDIKAWNPNVANFTLKAGIFMNENGTKLKKKSMESTKLTDFNVYMDKRGYVVLDLPNAYNRLTYVPNNQYCYDFNVIETDRGAVLEPRYFLVYEVRMEAEQSRTNFTLMTIAMLISCFFLILVLIVYGLLKELRNLCGMILMAYVASMLFSFMFLVIHRVFIWGVIQCKILTFFTYFFFLASFCWMNVMSYDIWWTFRGYAKARPIHRRGEFFKFVMYGLYAWGLPFFLSNGLMVLNEVDMKRWPWFVTPKIPQGGCFVEGGEKLLYLYMPMMILIVCNWLFYLMTAFNIWRLSRGTAVLDTAAAGTPQAHRSNRQRFLVYLKLSIVMGLNWVLEVVSFWYPGVVWHVSDFYNILIGLVIFIVFVCKPTVAKRLRKRSNAFQWSRRESRNVASTSSRSNSTDSDSSQETQTLQICVNPKGPYEQNTR